jgi:very-short-patch-repair endonuclease
MDSNAVVHSYVQEKKSIYQVAKEFNTYPNRIRRILQERRVKLRDKSTAQKLAIEKGLHKHPTKGKKHRQDTKDRIAKNVSLSWSELKPEERAYRSNVAKYNWNLMTETEKRRLCQLAGEGVRKAAEIGSKLERYILSELGSIGYKVEFHRSNFLKNEDLQIDILISDIKVAIEIDGPSHFLPIWGQDVLIKNMRRDKEKNGLLMSEGYNVIRVKHLAKTLSIKHKTKALQEIVEILEKIKISSGPNLYELEVV